MAETPDNALNADRDDSALSWLTQDHRARLDWKGLDDEQFAAEAAAALYNVARLDRFEALPADLAAKVLAAAHPPVAVPTPAPRRPGFWENARLAWGAASLAGLATVALAVRLATLAPAAPGPQNQHVALTDARHYAMQPGPDAAGKLVQGEVVWDPSMSGGYFKVSGLPINDPLREQYQLWIFDAARDQRFPVDGGVFNVQRNGETEVWIRVPVPVRDAALFAVTVEHAGGTVVSDRGRIVATAKIKT